MLLDEKAAGPLRSFQPSSNPFAEAILSFIEEIKDNDDRKSIFYKEVVQVACRMSMADKSIDQSLTAANDLSKYISDLETQHQKKSTTRKVFTWTQPLVQGLLQYTSAVDVMIQADPTVSALIYGGAKLVLQLANSYAKAFDQITQMMADIGVQLQYFHIYTQEFATDRYMSEILFNSYRNILLFWRDTSKILNQRGKRFLIGGLFVPLNERYSKFKDKLDKNAQDVRHMAQALHVQKQGAFNTSHAAQIQTVVAALERADTSYPPHSQEPEDVSKHNEIKRWVAGGRLSKVDPRGDLDRHLSSRHSGTAEWIFRDPIYEGWQRSSESCSLWVNAAPGSGKSVLAASIIDTLLHSTKKERQNTIYFFCRFDDPEKCRTISALKSLAIQALKLTKYIPDELWQLYQDECSGDDCFVSDHIIVERVLGMLLKRIEYVHIVIDGLDECRDHALLESLIKLRDQKGFGITKWLFTSRNDAIIQKKFEKSSTEILAVPKKVVQNDIRKFLEDNEDLLCGTCDQLDRITKLSQGNFLMMRLTIDPFRNEELTCSEEFEEALANFQPGLGRCWFRSLQRLSHRTSQVQELAQIIFRAVLLAAQPMTISELLDLVAVKIGEEPSTRRQRTRSVVLSACSPFIELDYETDFVNPTLRLVHKSIRDFLLQDPETIDYVTEDCYKFFVNPMAGHVDIGRRCLTYLSYKRYADFSKLNLEEDNPQDGLLKYASVFWHKHLGDAGGDHELFQEVSKFLKSPNFWTCIRVQSKYAPHIFAKLSYDSKTETYEMLIPNTDAEEKDGEEYYADALPPWIGEYDNRGDNLVWGYHMMVREWGEALVRYPDKIQPYFAKVLGSRGFWYTPKVSGDEKVIVKAGKRTPTWQHAQQNDAKPSACSSSDSDPYILEVLKKEKKKCMSQSCSSIEIGPFSAAIHRYKLKPKGEEEEEEEEDNDSDEDDDADDNKSNSTPISNPVMWFLAIEDSNEEKHWYHHLSNAGFLQKSQPFLIPDSNWLIWPQDETSILMINTETWESSHTVLKLDTPTSDQFIISQDHHYSPLNNTLHRASIYGTSTAFKTTHTIFPVTSSHPPKISPPLHPPQETAWRYPSINADLPATFHWQDDDTLYAILGCPSVKIFRFPPPSPTTKPQTLPSHPLFIPSSTYQRNPIFTITPEQLTLTLQPHPRFDLPSLTLTFLLDGAAEWKDYDPNDGESDDGDEAMDTGAFLKGVYAAKEQAFSVPIRSGLDWRRSVYVTCW